MTAPETITLTAAREALRSGKISASELGDACRARVKEQNDTINAFLEVFEEGQSESTDAVLGGIPIAVKDNILVRGQVSSCGSRMLASYRASYDAGVSEKLRGAGATIFGRTNMDEFAMGSSNEHSAFGPVRNPHDTERVPGGSSGGSAAAVASGMVPAALGSDTGGSIRQPASFCGVVGLKPTYGAVSRSGLVAMASSLDQIGTLAKTVEDAQLLYEAIKGHDPKDSTSVSDDARQTEEQKYQKEPKTIGVPRALLDAGEGMDADVREAFNNALSQMEKQGYTLHDIDLPYSKYALAAYYILMPAESSTNLARFDGVRYGLHKDGNDLLGDYLETRGEGFGPEVRKRILLGTYVLSAGYYDAYYRSAQAVRRSVRAEFDSVFEAVDVIAMPTTPTPAFKIGEKVSDPLALYLSDFFTVPANIAGIPGISVPAGTVERDAKNLPVGMQFLAPDFAEARLFSVGGALETVLAQ